MTGFSQEFQAIADTMKRVAAGLRGEEIDFALAGSLAFWARGGPETVHDLDVVVRAEDAERAAAALERLGMPLENPPEGWLVKAWDGDVLVDIIWELSGIEEVGEVLERAEDLRLQALDVRVIAVEDAFVSKLFAFDEHNLDFGPLLRIARSIREQVNWDAVRERTASWPYARAFLALLAELDVAGGPGGAGPAPEGRRGPVVTRAAPLGS